MKLGDITRTRLAQRGKEVLLNKREVLGIQEQHLVQANVLKHYSHDGGFTHPPGPSTLCPFRDNHFVTDFEFRCHLIFRSRPHAAAFVSWTNYAFNSMILCYRFYRDIVQEIS
jgi:hypothetical protein